MRQSVSEAEVNRRCVEGSRNRKGAMGSCSEQLWESTVGKCRSLELLPQSRSPGWVEDSGADPTRAAVDAVSTRTHDMAPAITQPRWRTGDVLRSKIEGSRCCTKQRSTRVAASLAIRRHELGVPGLCADAKIKSPIRRARGNTCCGLNGTGSSDTLFVVSDGGIARGRYVRLASCSKCGGRREITLDESSEVSAVPPRRKHERADAEAGSRGEGGGFRRGVV